MKTSDYGTVMLKIVTDCNLYDKNVLVFHGICQFHEAIDTVKLVEFLVEA